MKTYIPFRVLLLAGLLSMTVNGYSQEKDSNERFVKVDSSHPDAVILDGTDIFESNPLCILITNQAVTLLDEKDGEYVKIRAICKGDTVIGWIKSKALGKEPLRTHAKVTESASAKAVAMGIRASVGYEPIDTTGMRSNTSTADPKGTGRTTGVIGEIPVTNKGSKPIPIAPQSVYIPSDGKYQGYVGRIVSGHIVPAGQTVIVPVTGYCTDVHKPPVPAGIGLPHIDTWISVRNPDIPEGAPAMGLSLVPGKVVQPFIPDYIPMLIALPGFEAREPTGSGDYINVWPGTNTPIGGIFVLSNVTKNLHETAKAMISVDVVMRIENKAYEMVRSGTVSTPFTGDDFREAEALTQQTAWIVLAGIFGETYTKNDFTGQIVSQFEKNTGTDIHTSSEETKENLKSGIDQFWSSFHLVGVDAKVLSKEFEGADLSDVKAHTGGAAEKAADQIGADAIAPGNEIHIGKGSPEATTAHEVAHTAQDQTAAVSTAYDDVNYIDDYKDVGDGGTGRKKYDEYTVERELNGKNHEDACKAVGIKTDSSMGKSFKRVYNKQKSK